MTEGLKLNIKIGFTGTRQGMSADQLSVLRERLSPPTTNWGMFSEFHHGDCVGADEEAHDMIRVLLARHWPMAVRIVIHPPSDERWRAHCDALMDYRELLNVRVLDEKGYLERDRDIVDATDMLIGCPASVDLRSHGGTAYTLRYALALKKPVIIIWPDGRVEAQNFGTTPGERNEAQKEMNKQMAKGGTGDA